MVITRGAVFEEHEETAPQFASNTLVLKGPYPTYNNRAATIVHSWQTNPIANIEQSKYNAIYLNRM